MGAFHPQAKHIGRREEGDFNALNSLRIPDWNNASAPVFRVEGKRTAFNSAQSEISDFESKISVWRDDGGDTVLDDGELGQLGIEDLSVPELLQGVRFDPNKTMVSQVFEIIRRLIITVRLRPGQKISENEISEALHASKTPVREALIRLEDAGLVIIVPKSGTFVAPIRIDRYIDACFMRLQLETGAVRRAAQMAAGNVEALDAVIARQVEALEADEYVRFFELDEALHQAIFEISGIGGVWETAKRAQTELYRIRHLKRICNIRRGPVIVDQHRAIVDAIRSGSPDDAEKALVGHIGSLEQEIASLSMSPGLFDHIEKLNAPEHRPRQRRA